MPARAPTFSIRAVAQLLPVWRKCGTAQLFSSTPTGFVDDRVKWSGNGYLDRKHSIPFAYSPRPSRERRLLG